MTIFQHEMLLIYDNFTQEIIIINKLAGVSVQGGEGVAYPLDRELPKQTGHEIFLVHRLDKDTSGLMIAAKTKPAAAKWSKRAEIGRASCRERV